MIEGQLACDLGFRVGAPYFGPAWPQSFPSRTRMIEQERAATVYTVGYGGVSIPVIAVALVLEHLSPRATLLIFGIATAAGIAAGEPVLVRTDIVKHGTPHLRMEKCHEQPDREPIATAPKKYISA